MFGVGVGVGQYDWNVMDFHNPTQNSIMVPNQESYVPYEIMVEAFNRNGLAKEPARVYIGKSLRCILYDTRSAPAVSLDGC